VQVLKRRTAVLQKGRPVLCKNANIRVGMKTMQKLFLKMVLKCAFNSRKHNFLSEAKCSKSRS
jgi:hypothetical protein